MASIHVAVEATLPQSPAEICEEILDLSRWPSFTGYGPIPGIASAEFLERKEGVVGTRFAVTNRDGTRHVEEIVEYTPDASLVLRMGEFTAPVSFIADHFIERWEFHPSGADTRVKRTMELHPRFWVTWVVLRGLSMFLRKALEKHLAMMASGDTPDVPGP